MKPVDNWRRALHLGSVQVAGTGAILGALAAGLMASGAAVPWLGLLPTWAVFAGGALICALTVAARLFMRSPPRYRGSPRKRFLRRRYDG